MSAVNRTFMGQCHSVVIEVICQALTLTGDYNAMPMERFLRCQLLSTSVRAHSYAKGLRVLFAPCARYLRMTSGHVPCPKPRA